MHARRVAVVAVVGLLALPGLADAGPSPVATGVRFGSHRVFTRVVVDFGGTISARRVEFGGLSAKVANVRVAGATTNVNRAGGQGVRVSLQPGTQKLHISLSSFRHRFKYLGYAVVGGNRLAIDLWKSAPPPVMTGSHTCRGLRIATDWAANGYSVWVNGREHGIFENQFQVVVRGHDGAVVGRKTVHGPGKWRAEVHYHVAHDQSGTVEAVAFSPKNGALECLAQEWLSLPAR